MARTFSKQTVNGTEYLVRDLQAKKDTDEIKSAISYIESGSYECVENGSVGGAGKSGSAENRIRTDYIRFVKGDKIVIENGTMEHICSMFLGDVSVNTNTRNDYSFITTDETIIPDYDGTIIIAFRFSNNVDLSPAEFDGSVKKYSVPYTYDYETDENESILLFHKVVINNPDRVALPVDVVNNTQITIRTQDRENFTSLKQVQFFESIDGEVVDYFATGEDYGNKRDVIYTKNQVSKYVALSGYTKNIEILIRSDDVLERRVESMNPENITKAIGASLIANTGYFYVDVLTGQVDIRGGFIDIVYGISGNIFKRFEENTQVCTIAGSGSGKVKYLYDSDEFVYGGTDNGIVIATTFGKYFYPVSDNIKVVYSDGTTNYPRQVLSQKVDDGLSIPGFVNVQARDAFKRILDWENGQDTFKLAFITDVHTQTLGRYVHVGYLNYLSDVFNFGILVNGGDIGLDFNESETEAYNILYDTRKEMDTHYPWIFCKGNHERNIDTATLGCIFNKTFMNNAVFGDEEGSYGYCDIEDIRIIFLNTTDAAVGTSYAISSTQINWLISTLTQTEDKKVIICTHQCIDDIGRWNSGSPLSSTEYIAYKKMLADFVSKSSGNEGIYSWDFTENSSKLVCNISGDSHFNNQIKRNDVNYIVRQGYGSISAAELPEGATSDTVNANAYVCFDVLAVKDDGNAKVFRIGLGGSERDYSFTY